MVKGIYSSDCDAGAALLVDNGFVEDLSCAFTVLTGYSKADFYRKNISDTMKILLGSEFTVNNLEDHKTTNAFLFKKSREAIEVNLLACQLSETNKKLYLFEQKLNFILDAGPSFMNKIMEDNQIGVGVFTCLDFRLLKANTKYLGYIQDTYHKDGNLVGLCLKDVIPDFTGGKWEELLLRIVKTRQPVCMEEIKTTKGQGDCQYWNDNLTPVIEEDKVSYIISTLQDVTESVLKRKQLEERNDELIKRIEMKDELMLLISHELKTPLSIITSSIQTIELTSKNELPDKVKKYLDKIQQNAYRQMKLVNNILDSTRLNSGLFQLNPKKAEIIHLTREIIESISAFAERKQIKILFSSTVSRMIMRTDVELYERILLNLLSNAIKFSPEGKSIEVKIFKVFAKGNHRVCIQVKDNGIGIPSDKRELIFERFGQVDKILARHAEGTGIGLYLVKMLVSLLEGEIKLESKEGVGSTFSVFFPYTNSNKTYPELEIIKNQNEHRNMAASIECSDVYYGI